MVKVMSRRSLWICLFIRGPSIREDFFHISANMIDNFFFSFFFNNMIVMNFSVYMNNLFYRRTISLIMIMHTMYDSQSVESDPADVTGRGRSVLTVLGEILVCIKHLI